MKSIYPYKFYKTKYGEELLIDVVALNDIRSYIDKHPVHTLSYYDITFVTGGTGNFSIGDKRYSLCRGDVVFSKPGEIRAWDKSHLPQGYALIFEEEFLLSFFNDRSFIQHLAYFHKSGVAAKINVLDIFPRVENSIQNILAEIDSGQTRDKHLLRALLYEILMLLNREYLKIGVSDTGKPTERYIDDFISLVDKNFIKHHDTRYYASELCITPNYLNEIVRKNLHVSPKHYIQNKIIREAKLLLVYTSLSVSEVADRLNFENASYFIRLFRKHTAFTPLQYRQNVVR